MNLQDIEKQLAARRAVEYINDGYLVGIGTGSTVKFVIEELAKKVNDGLKINTVASSSKSEELLKQANIRVLKFKGQTSDIYIDSADEVDNKLNMIKGGGGALLREKVLAYNSKYRVIVIDESKLKNRLGTYPLPIEVIPFSYLSVINNIERMGAICEIRKVTGKTYLTDNKNYIIDCKNLNFENPEVLYKKLKYVPGVVEVGLFIGFIDTLLIGKEDKVEEISGLKTT
ncbi:MAG: ribose-5-phosphate isomerase RpiA [Thermoplasmata archaeon]